jgi:hypothetical protein
MEPPLGPIKRQKSKSKMHDRWAESKNEIMKSERNFSRHADDFSKWIVGIYPKAVTRTLLFGVQS